MCLSDRFPLMNWTTNWLRASLLLVVARALSKSIRTELISRGSNRHVNILQASRTSWQTQISCSTPLRNWRQAVCQRRTAQSTLKFAFIWNWEIRTRLSIASPPSSFLVGFAYAYPLTRHRTRRIEFSPCLFRSTFYFGVILDLSWRERFVSRLQSELKLTAQPSAPNLSHFSTFNWIWCP